MNNVTNEKFKMKYTLATNFDTNLIEGIKSIDKDNSIKSVYGKLKSDIVGGGRSAMLLPELSMNDLENYIQLCHQNNLKFNYLLNPVCMGNKEFVKDSHNQIISLIDSLVTSGIDAVTINSPYLCEVIKKQFPKLKVSIGAGGYITEMQHVKFWEELGADELTLQHNVNRNFNMLENMLNYTKKSGISLRLIANNVCLHGCPYRIAHGTGQSHASKQNESSQKFHLDYHIIKCTLDKIKNPAELIAAEWIRPEDVKYYEQLCEKTGNYNLFIKLVDRTKTTDFLLRVISAYLSQSYAGSLLDLLLWPSLKEFAQVNKAMGEAVATLDAQSMENLGRYFGVFKLLPDVYVDNKKLDGFIEKFISKYDCCDKVCDQAVVPNHQNTADNDPSKCSYCRNWAEKAISFDRQQIEDWVNNSRELINDMCESKFFR
ncbi:collagenase-like PrtC family protease [Sporomusaceae bacterium BoRhaA]|uniref:U32 family peptidase n=1 Tax=Pelorhabdus rhamnosifermentans TaxID=2772457 RepID=UPI001C062CBF|nr:U32 family peptidase [Pelorhabdus rhamnosifermentans]MBU2699291.1 collagenase-like PrtC family protease [Pelorhabdus rhamnosifermentans]